MRNRRQRTQADAAFKMEEEKRRREEALAQATGLRVLKAIGEAVPVRLMKRDLLFLEKRLTAMLDERKLAVLIRQHGIGKPKDTEGPAKLLSALSAKSTKANSDASWLKQPFSYPCTTRATRRRFCAKPRRSTKWTWTRSRSK